MGRGRWVWSDLCFFPSFLEIRSSRGAEISLGEDGRTSQGLAGSWEGAVLVTVDTILEWDGGRALGYERVGWCAVWE